MQRNILEYLERTAARCPDKAAFVSPELTMTFSQVLAQARSVGTALHKKGYNKQPMVVFMPKHPHTLTAFFLIIA